MAGTHDRLGDVCHRDFFNGRVTYFDVSVVNTFQACSVNISFVATGEVALQGKKLKDAKHAEAVERVGGVFVPLVVETLGVWSPLSLKILKQIVAPSTKCSALDANVAAKHLFQQHSVKPWTCNAKLLLHSLSTLPDCSLGFCLYI